MDNILEIREKIKNAGLKVTPQRMELLKVFYDGEKHPTAEQILEKLRKTFPNLSAGTVYHILDKFVEKGIILRICTEKNAVRFDAVTDKHHHIVSADDRVLMDYRNEELDRILEEYFAGTKIEGFKIKDFQLRIVGEPSDPGLKGKR